LNVLVSNTGMLLVTAVFLSLLSAGPQARITLATELHKHGVVPTGRLDDLDREITSYAVASDESWFAIAYYWHTGSDLLPPELRVRTLDRRTDTWRSAVFDPNKVKGGSALRIARRPGFVYLDLHVNPSAGRIVVLSEDLKVQRSLDGWSSLILQDGRVLYRNSMVHFAPAHPGSVSLYDPRSGAAVGVYPLTPDPASGAEFVDRRIGTIEMAGPTQIRMAVSEQNVKLGPDNKGVPVGVARDATVTCDISKPTPVCVVQPKEKGRQN
jgi:hypothetical protein